MNDLCGVRLAEIENDTLHVKPINRSNCDDNDVVGSYSEELYFDWACKTLLRGWSVLGRDKKLYFLADYPNYDIKIVAALVVG